VPKGNIVQRTLRGEEKRDHPEINAWVEGRFIYYKPTFFPAHEVKEWGGVRWDGQKKAWRIPKLTRLARKIVEYDAEAHISKDVLRLTLGDWETVDQEVAQGLEVAEQHSMFSHLYGFQQLAVLAAVTRPFHGLMLALSPGLGKTPTSIVASEIWCALHGESQRILVVSPLPLLPNWYREITGTQMQNPLQWSADPRVEVVHGGEPTPDRSVRWTVTNYDTVMERVKDPNTGRWSASGNLDSAWDLDWDVVIFEESVLLKNRKSKRTSSCRTLGRSAHKVLELSGAPITRDNSDIWAQFNVMEPDYFTSFWDFAKEACIVIKTQWTYGEIVGSRKNFDLKAEFPEVMFVRNQEQVLPDLPDYIYKDIELPLTRRQKKAHDDIMDKWIHELEYNADKRVEVTAVIAMLTRLQQVTSNLYNLETTGTEWPDESSKADFLEYDLGEVGDIEWPVLIWTHHRPGATALLQRLRKHAEGKSRFKKESALFGRRVELVYGGMGKKADAIIEDYKAGKVDVLILGIQVGKYGHTLVNTRTVYAYDKTWDSDAWFQMLHRVRRNGLKHCPLFKTLRCRGTVDDYVELNLAGKLPDMAKLTGADLAKVLRSLGEDMLDV
jgi:hypothetical protein